MSENQAIKFNSDEAEDYVTMYIDDQLFGIPILEIQDIIGASELTPVPLAPSDVIGVLNLRGRIVTVFDLRVKLGLENNAHGSDNLMNIVIEKGEDLYSIIVDSVGDVLTLDKTHFENTPGTLSETWKNVSQGVFRLQEELMVLLDVNKVINYQHAN